MATKITQDKIIEINRTYKRLRTYAATGRELGISPTTVKKYVIDDFEEPEVAPSIYTPIEIPQFDYNDFISHSKTEMFKLTETEIENLIELRKEILI